VSACDLDLDVGIGSLKLLRYYFDRKRRMCVEFRYRGSGKFAVKDAKLTNYRRKPKSLSFFAAMPENLSGFV
jgi:hypothetical protein